jgi:hypothetical protein
MQNSLIQSTTNINIKKIDKSTFISANIFGNILPILSPLVFPFCAAIKELLKSNYKILGIYLGIRGEKGNFKN